MFLLGDEGEGRYPEFYPIPFYLLVSDVSNVNGLYCDRNFVIMGAPRKAMCNEKWSQMTSKLL